MARWQGFPSIRPNNPHLRLFCRKCDSRCGGVSRDMGGIYTTVQTATKTWAWPTRPIGITSQRARNRNFGSPPRNARSRSAWSCRDRTVAAELAAGFFDQVSPSRRNPQIDIIQSDFCFYLVPVVRDGRESTRGARGNLEGRTIAIVPSAYRANGSSSSGTVDSRMRIIGTQFTNPGRGNA